MTDRPERGCEPSDPRELDREARLDDLLLEYIDRLNAGEVLNRRILREEHPSLADEIWSQLEAFEKLVSRDPSSPALEALGDYTLRREIGRGGMGIVYEAWQASMDRVVALKVLPPTLAAREKPFLRFLREAKAAGRLHHSSIVSVYSSGVEDGTPWYSMEYVEGKTLAQVLEETHSATPRSPTPFGPKDEKEYFENLAEAFAQVADGLQHAHSRRVIHRDLKPSNLILDSRASDSTPGRATFRILDFGLARLEGQDSLTESGDFVGTLLYMSPEQARRREIEIDHRTDIYSLGATMYEALSGRPPFRGKNHSDTLSLIADSDPVGPRKLRATIPLALETIVLKCLEKEPQGRYHTAEALGQDLARFARGDPVEARPVSNLERWIRRVRRHRGKISVGVLLLSLLTIVAWLVPFAVREEQRRREAAYQPLVDTALEEFRGAIFGQDLHVGHELWLQPSGLWTAHESLTERRRPLYESVEHGFSRAVELMPERPDAYWHRARVRMLLGDEPGAIADLETTTRLASEHAPAWQLLASLREARGERAKAREARLHASISAEQGWAHIWLDANHAALKWDWFRAEKRFDDALRWLDENGDEEPFAGWTLEVRLQKSAVFALSKRPIAALQELAVVEHFWPESIECQILQAQVWYGSQSEERLASAELHLERAARLAKSPIVADEVAAFAFDRFLGARDRERASAWLSRIQSQERKAWAIAFEIARFAKSTGPEAELRRKIRSRPDDASLHFELAVLLMRRGPGQYSPALRQLKEGLRVSDEGLERQHGQALHALLLARLGFEQEAREILEPILQQSVSAEEELRHAALLARFSEALFELGEEERAITILNHAIRLRPDDGDQQLVAAEGILNREQPRRALKYASRAIEMRGDSRDFKVRASILEKLDREDEELADLRQACTRDPPEFRPWLRLGEVLERRKDLQLEAFDAYLRALEKPDLRSTALSRLLVLSKNTDTSFDPPRARLVDWLQANFAEIASRFPDESLPFLLSYLSS